MWVRGKACMSACLSGNLDPNGIIFSQIYELLWKIFWHRQKWLASENSRAEKLLGKLERFGDVNPIIILPIR